MEVAEVGTEISKSSTSVSESSKEEVVPNSGTTTKRKSIEKITEPQEHNGDHPIAAKVANNSDNANGEAKGEAHSKPVTEEVEAANNSAHEVEEEEVIEVIEGNESGEEVEITETIVVKTPATATTTTKTVKTTTTSNEPETPIVSETKKEDVSTYVEEKPQTKFVEEKEVVKEEKKVEKPEEIVASVEPRAHTQSTTSKTGNTDITLALQSLSAKSEAEAITNTESIQLSPQQVIPSDPAETQSNAKTTETKSVQIPLKTTESTSETLQIVEAPISAAVVKALSSTTQERKQQIQQQVGLQQCAFNIKNLTANSSSTLDNNQDNINNTLKEIISDIDRVIKQEDVQQQYKLQQQQLLEQQQHLLKEQQRLAQQIQQQQRLAQLQQEQAQQQQQHYQQQAQSQLQPHSQLQSHVQPPIVSKSSTTEESHSDTGYLKKNESYEVEENGDFRMVRSSMTTIKESHNPGDYSLPKEHRSMSLPTWGDNREESSSTISKKVDIQKIFTPATDAEEMLPKNRKLFASSAFYSPNLHPTVEDQVALARRISHSLSDISNQQSKGQSMYVNRKKRSVKWVHEGSGQAKSTEYYEECKENDYDSNGRHNDKVPLKLVMNPRGQVRDLSSIHEPMSETGLLSPDKCAKLVTALNAPKGRGAELFAKRRRKAENWIVDPNSVPKNPSDGPVADQYQAYKPATPRPVPAYSDVDIRPVQLNLQRDNIQDKYSQPSLELIKSPWEAALETGSARNTFNEKPNVKELVQQKPLNYNNHRDLAYKPSIPQGWKAPAVALPRDSTSSSAFAFLNTSQAMDSMSMSTELILKTETSDAANKCGDFTHKDEDEIIRLVEKVELHTPEATISENQLCNCVTRSPEPIISETKNRLQNYNTAIQELQIALETIDKCEFQQKQQYKQCDEHISQQQQYQEQLQGYETNYPVKKTDEDTNKYVKVPVRELILTFEQQSGPEKEVTTSQAVIKPINKITKDTHEENTNFVRHENNHDEGDRFNCIVKDVQLSTDSEKDNTEKHQELYVPKEIPLESYAPPPVSLNYPSDSSDFPVYQLSSNPYPKNGESKSYSSGLQLTKSQYGQPQSPQTFARIQPPKQQSWDSCVYQQQPPPAQSTPVNFTPSPLSYDKLAKFDLPGTQTIPSYQTPYLPRLSATHSIPGQVGNASPVPFSSGRSPVANQTSTYGSNSTTLASTRKFPQQFPSQNQDYKPYTPSTSSRVSSVDLTHCQNFNTVARGWSGNRKAEPYRPVLVVPTIGKPLAANLPYSDF